MDGVEMRTFSYSQWHLFPLQKIRIYGNFLPYQILLVQKNEAGLKKCALMHSTLQALLISISNDKPRIYRVGKYLKGGGARLKGQQKHPFKIAQNEIESFLKSYYITQRGFQLSHHTEFESSNKAMELRNIIIRLQNGFDPKISNKIATSSYISNGG